MGSLLSPTQFWVGKAPERNSTVVAFTGAGAVTAYVGVAWGAMPIVQSAEVSPVWVNNSTRYANCWLSAVRAVQAFHSTALNRRRQDWYKRVSRISLAPMPAFWVTAASWSNTDSRRCSSVITSDRVAAGPKVGAGVTKWPLQQRVVKTSPERTCRYSRAIRNSPWRPHGRGTAGSCAGHHSATKRSSHGFQPGR
jgi:hypothetical protein